MTIINFQLQIESRAAVCAVGGDVQRSSTLQFAIANLQLSIVNFFTHVTAKFPYIIGAYRGVVERKNLVRPGRPSVRQAFPTPEEAAAVAVTECHEPFPTYYNLPSREIVSSCRDNS